jgi:hypothetical protein
MVLKLERRFAEEGTLRADEIRVDGIGYLPVIPGLAIEA